MEQSKIFTHISSDLLVIDDRDNAVKFSKPMIWGVDAIYVCISLDIHIGRDIMILSELMKQLTIYKGSVMKKISLVAMVSVALLFAFSGCDSNKTIKLNPAVSGTYKVSQETLKEVNYSQPSLGKNDVNKTSTVTEMTFDQKVDSVEKDGSAKLTITIKAIKLYSKGKKGVVYDFDSSRKSDSKDPLSELIGVSYNIVVNPKGKVVAVDAKKALETVKSREAKAFLRKDIIQKRHNFKAAPESDAEVITKTGEWSCVASSPKGALEPKAFEKKYKVVSVDKNGIAKISMEAVPTNKKPEGGVKGRGLGIMAGIFDSKETFAGEMLFDTKSGSVVKYTEKLQDNYVAAQEASEGKTDKGPDVLKMTFTSTYSVEKLNQ